MEYGIKQPLRIYENLADRNVFAPGGDNSPFCLICPANMLLPFEIKRPSGAYPLTSIKLIGSSEMELLTYMDSADLQVFSFAEFDYIVHYGILAHTATIPAGKYYLMLSDSVNTWYSEDINFIAFNGNTLDLCVPTKITYWDTCDVDAIFYRTGEKQYKNIIYLDVDIGKPEYPVIIEASEDAFGSEVVEFAKLEKTYILQGVFPQFMVDALCLLPLHFAGVIEVLTHRGYTGNVLTVTVDPKWQGTNGALALTDISFVVDRVIKTNCCGDLETPNIYCLTGALEALAVIVEGSTNYIIFEYTNALTSAQVPLVDGDKVLIKYLSGATNYRRYKASTGTYIPSGVFFNGGGVIDLNALNADLPDADIYYYYNVAAGRFYTDPAISSIDTPTIISAVGDKTLQGRGFRNAIIEVWEIIGGTAVKVFIDTGEQLNTGGITYPHNPAATVTYIKAVGLNCELGESKKYFWAGEPLGIGIMAVGSTFIVGEDESDDDATE